MVAAAMRVLLVQAFTALDMELVYPLGLAYLAAHLEDRHAVDIFDVNLHRADPYAALEAKVRAFQPGVVGISLRNMKVGMPHLHTDDFEPQQKAIQLIKRIAPGVKIVAGGTAFSLYSETMMRRLPEVDIGVWGEAELRFRDLLDDIDHPEKLKGMYFWKGGELVYTGQPGGVDWKQNRRPARQYVDHAPYMKSSFVSVGVQAKRGCSLHCIHCSDTFLLGHRVRMRDPVEVVDEMEFLRKEHAVDQMFMCDQIFNIPVSHAIAICDEISRRKLDLKWSAWFNEHRNTLPDELMVALKRAGCGLLSFSPDHVDDRMLRNLDKNFRKEDMLYTVQVAKKHGMDVEYSFFLNSPGEDARSLFEIVKFLAHARWELGGQLRLFTLLMMQPIRLYPHTRLHELARETGLIDRDHELVEGQFWNPGLMQYATAGIQAAAHTLYDARQSWRKARGNTFDSVVRE